VPELFILAQAVRAAHQALQARKSQSRKRHGVQAAKRWRRRARLSRAKPIETRRARLVGIFRARCCGWRRMGSRALAIVTIGQRARFGGARQGDSVATAFTIGVTHSASINAWIEFTAQNNDWPHAHGQRDEEARECWLEWLASANDQWRTATRARRARPRQGCADEKDFQLQRIILARRTCKS